MANKERREVYYRGNVQGVGFRMTAQRVARRYDVTGFVRNLPDGRVQLVAEGETSQLKPFLDEVARAMSGYIADSQVNPETATGDFSDFGVRY